jgi:peptidoglycan/xylan/chitin deacetylase (PgdA/CDA1 family)
MDLKSQIYSIARRFGVFHLTRLLTANGARVLCYHGVVPDDDDLADFWPKLFMRRTTLARRLDQIRRSRLQVLSLDEVLESVRAGKALRKVAVLTFDDGWHGTIAHGFPLLAERSMPSTLYVSTYYSVTERPVFNVAVRYLFWRYPNTTVDLTESEFQAETRVVLRVPKSAPDDTLSALIDFGDSLSGERRFALLMAVAQRLGAPAVDAVTSRRLTLATLDELRASRSPLASLQLHSHRHVAPVASQAALATEISDNRTALEQAGATNLRHFCYPSGIFAPQHAPWLRALGVDSATTTVPGRWTPQCDPYFVPRFVESEAYSDELVEAELAGAQDLLRAARRALPIRN